jgi:hypothetical protein
LPTSKAKAGGQLRKHFFPDSSQLSEYSGVEQATYSWAKDAGKGKPV